MKTGSSYIKLKQRLNLIHCASRLELNNNNNNNNNTIITTVTSCFYLFPSLRNKNVKSDRLSGVLPSPPRVAFRNPKTLRDRLVRSKLKIEKEEPVVYKCGHSNCEICNVLKLGDEFQSTSTGKKYKINFKFDCNSMCVVCLCNLQSLQKTVRWIDHYKISTEIQPV